MKSNNVTLNLGNIALLRFEENNTSNALRGEVESRSFSRADVNDGVTLYQKQKEHITYTNTQNANENEVVRHKKDLLLESGELSQYRLNKLVDLISKGSKIGDLDKAMISKIKKELCSKNLEVAKKANILLTQYQKEQLNLLKYRDSINSSVKNIYLAIKDEKKEELINPFYILDRHTLIELIKSDSGAKVVKKYIEQINNESFTENKKRRNILLFDINRLAEYNYKFSSDFIANITTRFLGSYDKNEKTFISDFLKTVTSNHSDIQKDVVYKIKNNIPLYKGNTQANLIYAFGNIAKNDIKNRYSLIGDVDVVNTIKRYADTQDGATKHALKYINIEENSTIKDIVYKNIPDISEQNATRLSKALAHWDDLSIECFLSAYHKNNFDDLLLIEKISDVNNDVISDVLDRDIYDSVSDFVKEVNTESKIVGSKTGFVHGSEKDLEILLEEIVEKNNSINIKSLKNDFDAVLFRYENDSGICSAGKAIKSWEKEDITKWSKAAKQKNASLKNEILEVLAVVKRANVIASNQEPRAIQILSLLLMVNNYTVSVSDAETSKGVLSQISTGEGKTSIVAMLAIINVLQGQKVDIITSSPILATDGAEKKKSFYDLFDISVGDNGSNGSVGCYRKDVVYGGISNFQFDYLKDKYMLKDVRQNRDFGVVIADEVDSMLIDEGSKIAMLSENIAGMEHLEGLLASIFITTNQFLECIGYDEDGKPSFVNINDESDQQTYIAFDTKRGLIEFIKENIKKATEQKFFSNSSNKEFVLPNNLKDFAKNQIQNWVDMSINACLMHKNKDYVIKNNEIKPVDFQNTGIIQTNTQWQNGLHQFIQMKHGVRMSSEGFTTSFISNVGYFRQYKNQVYGLTGTLGSIESKDLLSSTYKVNCIQIPTYKQKQFVELPAIVTESIETWADTIVRSVKIEVDRRRSVLIICESIQDVDNIKQQLINSGINEVKINCYADDIEDKGVDGIKVQSGQIIIATNLAGRGTDIDAEAVEAYGGLHICLTFLPENLRVEEQAFGRTARQGRQGTGQLIIIGSEEIEDIKKHRDAREKTRLAYIKDVEVLTISIKDELFLKEFMPYISSIRGSKSEYVIKSIEEHWGLFLTQQIDPELQKIKKDKNINIDQVKKDIFSKYKTFIGQFNNGDNIKNHCYHTLIGNDLIDSEKYNEAILKFNDATNLDPNFAYTAHYNKSFAILKNNGNDQDAKCELEKAKDIIESTLIPQLQAIGGVCGMLQNNAVSQDNGQSKISENMNMSGLDLQCNTKLSLLIQHKSYIEKAIEIIDKKDKNNSIVIDQEFFLESMYASEADIPTREIEELRNMGFSRLFTVKEKPPTDWIGIFCVIGLGILQVVAGAALTLCGAANIGVALIGEGIGDLITGVQSAISGEFNWKDYLVNKAISLAISVVTMGVSAIRAAVKAVGSVKEGLKAIGGQIKTVAKSVANKVAGKSAQKTATAAAFTGASKELSKSGMKIIGKKIGLELSEQGLTSLINYGVGICTKEIVKQFEDVIKKKVKEALQLNINKNSLNKILSSEDGNQKICQVANNFLSKQSSELLSIAEQFVTGLVDAANASAKNSNGKTKIIFRVLDKVMHIQGIVRAIEEAATYTSGFCYEINSNLEKLDAEQSSKNESQANIDQMIEHWSNEVTGRISNVIHGKIASPLSSRAVSNGVSKFSEGIQKSLSSQGHTFDKKLDLWNDKRRLHKGVDKIAGGKINQPNDKNKNSSHSADTWHAHNVDENRGTNNNLPKDRQGGMIDIAALSNHLDRPVEIYKDGKPYRVIGDGKAGDPIKLDYTSPSNEKPGHWEPHGAKAKQSGNNNCLFDAIGHQVGQNPHGLRDIADNVRNGSDKHVNKARHAEDNLIRVKGGSKGAKDAMIGGNIGIIEDSIYRECSDNEILSIIKQIRTSQSREEKNALRIHLVRTLKDKEHPSWRQYNDNIPPRAFSIEFSQNGVNRNFSLDTTSTGFPHAGQDVVKVGENPNFNSSNFQVGGFMHPKKPATIVASNNRGLAAHSIAKVPPRSISIDTSGNPNNRRAFEERQGDGRSIRFDKNNNNRHLGTSLENNPAGLLFRIPNDPPPISQNKKSM